MIVTDAPDTRLSPAVRTADRFLVALASFAVGVCALAVALLGPAGTGAIVYRWRENSTLVTLGQDFVNLFLAAPLCVLAGFLRWRDSPRAAYLTAPLGFYLGYFFLFYALGPEWTNPDYAGIQPTSQRFVFLFWTCIAGSVVLVVDGSARLVRASPPALHRGVVRAIAAFLVVSFSSLALMWIRDVGTVVRLGDLPNRAYSSGPTVFWLIKTFDLAVWVPFAGVCLYAFLTRPAAGGYGLLVLLLGFKALSLTALLSSLLVLTSHGQASSPAGVLLFGAVLVPTWTSFFYLTRARLFGAAARPSS